MSFERALIAQAQPYIVANRARDIIKGELGKGCRPDISPLPVSLEPCFKPLWEKIKENLPNDQPQWVVEEPTFQKNLIRLQVWISPEQQFDWTRCEIFIKQLQTLSYRACFEIVGNKEKLALYFLLHRSDLPILSAVFKGEYECCELESLKFDPIGRLPAECWKRIYFKDYFPSPPYSHLLTCPNELKNSPFNSLMTAISTIAPPAIGIYQVIFQAVSPNNNWHRNVEILLDFEYTIKLQSGISIPQRYPQQAPSGDLHQMAGEVENKAHNDKPFFAMAIRIGVLGENTQEVAHLEPMSTVAGLFQHGGRPLNHITEKEYLQVLPPNKFRKMFLFGKTYRPGFLVNSLELTGPVHIPPSTIFENRSISLEQLDTLPVRTKELMSGTKIGICDYAGNRVPVCISDDLRKKHVHLIGRPGMGKSTTQEHIILSDIQQGHGVAVLDPHGDLIERLLCLIPSNQVARCIYFNPGDPDWVPIWNPLKRIHGQDIGRMADDLVQSIQSFVANSGWGDRLEHLLRNMIFSICHLEKGTFLDISNLLRNKSEESKILRHEILRNIDNEVVRQFWFHDYGKYGKDDLGPPRNKLSKLLVSNTVSLMLSQPDSLFNFREIMDKGMILLVDLSGIGSKVRGILGSFILSLLHLNALSRSSLAISQRKQFHIHCDEAHRFMTDSLEDLIAETRKYNVSLSLAHQYMSQFGKRKTDAFGSVGSTIIFNVDSRDANSLIKDLQRKVKVENLVSLKRGEAIARIGTEIVRFETQPPFPISSTNSRDQIIELARKKYCRPAHEVRKWIQHRNDRWCKSFLPLTVSSKQSGRVIDEFLYDEFD